MKEIWKTIENYEGLYQVSNLGNVKSLKFGKEKILKPGVDGKGYFFVNLFKNGKKKLMTIHRLVAKAFLPNSDNLPCVNHKDKNPKNNNVNNLEFCTQQYNVEYSCAKKVGQYSKNGKLIKVWSSMMEAERNGFHRGNICSCCKGRLKSHHGFKWKYIDN